MASAPPPAQDALLLVLQLPIHRQETTLFIDKQAHNGLHRWLDNFEQVTVCMPVVDVTSAPETTMRIALEDFNSRCRVVCLPNDRSFLAFVRSLGSVSRQLDDLIDKHTHLSFALGGLFGDWAAVAGLRAHKKRRRFSIWADRVESQVIAFHAKRSHGLRKLYWAATALAMKHYERFVIRRSALGLFHGADCYANYSLYSDNPQLVHNIHLTAADRIAPVDLAKKASRGSAPLRIVYAGRAHAEKGVFDWIEALALLAQRGVKFEATWFGDGPDLDSARKRITALGLEQQVAFPSALHNHSELLIHIRNADVFMFCHKTAESPRCLIEALISGSPIVGYESAYPRELIAKNQGGVLTNNNALALADVVGQLANDRARLARLTYAAAADGRAYTDVGVFRHRSDLIKLIA